MAARWSSGREGRQLPGTGVLGKLDLAHRRHSGSQLIGHVGHIPVAMAKLREMLPDPQRAGGWADNAVDDTAVRLATGYGRIGAEYLDAGCSRSLPWDRRPRAADLVLHTIGTATDSDRRVGVDVAQKTHEGIVAAGGGHDRGSNGIDRLDQS